MHASVIVPAYNEEQNIAVLLRRLVGERSEACELDDIVVIASGCTDRTVPEAHAVQQQFANIRVLVQERREGKASAINLGLQAARQDNIVLVSGDVMPAPGSVAMLLRRLESASVGAAGGRPVPMNDASTFTGFACHLLWRLHHAVCELRPENPKLGEMVVFRRAQEGRAVVRAIPADSAVDEVSIQAMVEQAGLKSVYVGSAVVHMWGPSNVRDWFIQRRRIHAGHILTSRAGYRPSTMSLSAIVSAIVREPLARRRPVHALSTIGLEALARFAGRVDVLRGERHRVWKVARSTKRAIEDGVT